MKAKDILSVEANHKLTTKWGYLKTNWQWSVRREVKWLISGITKYLTHWNPGKR
jgi:hypothetical protein